MKRTLLILITGLFLLGTNQLYAQIEFLGNTRDDGGIAYNFFLGDDADDFTTTINGFGSGFIFDVFTGRYSIDIVTFGPEFINLSLGAGIAVNKYRFSDNLILSLNDVSGQVEWETDPDQTHDYVNTFFGYGKSKLVYTSFYFPANINLSVGPMLLSAGGFVDLYVAGRLKRKYKVDDDKQKNVVKNDVLKEFPFNKTKYGVNALLMHKGSGVGLGFTYMLTPMFIEGEGPALNEVRISLTYDFPKYKM